MQCKSNACGNHESLLARLEQASDGHHRLNNFLDNLQIVDSHQMGSSPVGSCQLLIHVHTLASHTYLLDKGMNAEEDAVHT